jgi:hypothetical protein
MSHKYSVGQNVYYDPPIRRSAASGIYKIIRQLPVENDSRLYRIKSEAESFERTADEIELRGID